MAIRSKCQGLGLLGEIRQRHESQPKIDRLGWDYLKKRTRSGKLAEQMRWPTVCITKDDRIVEPVSGLVCSIRLYRPRFVGSWEDIGSNIGKKNSEKREIKSTWKIKDHFYAFVKN